jgi:hypothetical protein
MMQPVAMLQPLMAYLLSAGEHWPAAFPSNALLPTRHAHSYYPLEIRQKGRKREPPDLGLNQFLKKGKR